MREDAGRLMGNGYSSEYCYEKPLKAGVMWGNDPCGEGPDGHVETKGFREVDDAINFFKDTQADGKILFTADTYFGEKITCNRWDPIKELASFSSSTGMDP